MEKYLTANLKKVARIIHDHLARNRTPVRAKLEQYFAGGGKLRPRIVLAAGKLVGAKPGELNQLAASLEMLHTATLIHDDLIDGTIKRRGLKTLHTTAAANVAVLGGDYLLAGSLSLAAGLGKAEVVGIVADALARLCAGEIAETFGRAGYYRNIADKTGVLFDAACTLACAAAGAGRRETRALKNFGLEIGTAYQIADDAADLQEDLRQGVKTLAVKKYLAGNQRGAVAETLRAAKRLADRGAGELAIFPPSPAREYLLALAGKIGS